MIKKNKYLYGRRNKFVKRKEKFQLNAIHVFTTSIMLICLFLIVDTHAVEIKTNSKDSFIYSLNSCIKDLNKDIPIEKQIPSELIVAQAVIETGWGTSRFANEANNLFGIHQGLKVYETKCDSVKDYMRIVNEVFAYAEFREMRGDGETDALVLARTLKRWAAEDHYTDLIEDVIKYNLRGKYDL